MSRRPSGAIFDHLSRRRVLSTVEQKWIDLDGDGRITSRDLLLFRSGLKPAKLPAFVPETRVVLPGQTVVCRVLGACPEDLRVRAAINGRVVDLPVAIRDGKDGRRVEIDLPSPYDPDKGPRRIVIWISSPARLPSSVTVTLQETQA